MYDADRGLRTLFTSRTNVYLDLRYWHEVDRGGHFAAFEHPGMFVDEVRACFAGLR